MSCPCHNIVIVGDFNLPQIQWVGGYAATGDNNDQIGPLLKCLQEHSLYQTINFPARYREGQNPSLLDLLFVKDEEAIQSIDPEPPFGASNHIAITC
jgi:hypothetical protein